jgi:hypothetical protein
LAFDDDDVPLALLKKQKFGHKDSTDLSNIEVAAISLTELQNATPIQGLVYNCLNSPLFGTLAHPNLVMPRLPFAAIGLSDFQVT